MLKPGASGPLRSAVARSALNVQGNRDDVKPESVLNGRSAVPRLVNGEQPHESGIERERGLEPALSGHANAGPTRSAAEPDVKAPRGEHDPVRVGGAQRQLERLQVTVRVYELASWRTALAPQVAGALLSHSVFRVAEVYVTRASHAAAAHREPTVRRWRRFAGRLRFRDHRVGRVRDNSASRLPSPSDRQRAGAELSDEDVWRYDHVAHAAAGSACDDDASWM